ncbi:Casein kinase II regulatory subunit family protein [Tritrichomonas foetus]|uniref:Casein kinase II subunit beta n=1 Tax=Tritrichomonas foetus TaxID=1144522 RepID=A0A1J4JZP5_9EUKA|nr:Casein kinase II regulatory subunit family protein [Tritrichomonas foetus]|eukprot:OHT03004.1 Casein kinase II regulatory subunit family protein [Tritrichomonas foetus]
MSSRQPSSRNPGHVIKYDNFQIYTGPCKVCQPGVEPWIRQFCKLNPWYVQIDNDWAGDWFNQYGIASNFDEFDAAVELMTDSHSADWARYSEEKICVIHQQAMKIYGMLHARWICQPKGMAAMKDKYEKGIYGKCIRYGCSGTHLLPMGTTFTLRRHSAKLFCPKCNDIYRAPDSIVLDGAHFGPAFPHMFLYEYKQFDKTAEFEPFEIKAFGFKIHRNPHSRFPVHMKNRYDQENPEMSTYKDKE